MKKKVTKILIATLLMVLAVVTVDFDLSWAETERRIDQNAVNAVAEEVEEEMEFLYIENRQLESPGTQNIAVAWDKDMSNVSEFILVYSDSKGNPYEIKETTRAEKSVLFAKEFSSSEAGTYRINGMKYIINDTEEEQYIDFKDLEIKADFEVVNKQNDSKVATVESNVATISTDVEALPGDVENLLSTASVEPANNKGSIVVVIDPGHGGDDPGTCHYGLKEKDINLKIGKYLRDELKEYSGVEVYMTRETDKHLETATASGITNRVNYAKGKNADLLVSVHINAVGGRGAEVWAPNENYRSDIYEEGQGVSQKILDELVALGLYNRGVKESYSKNNTQYPDKSLADYYGIIRQSKEAGFVGIIVEHAFLDNASDAAFLSKEENLKKLGIADATGIANYFALEKKVIGDVDRIYGPAACETAFGVAEQLKKALNIEKFDTIVVATSAHYADALSGSYLAKVNSAPILLIQESRVKSVEKYIKDNLEADGKVYVLGGPVAIPQHWISGIPNVKRLWGANMYYTNLEILKESGVSSGDEILICTGKSFYDSVSASATGKPILLVGDKLEMAQRNYLKELKAEDNSFSIIGGIVAVNEKIEKEFTTYGETKRIWGNTMYETTIEIAKAFFDKPEKFILAHGKTFHDGLTGGPLGVAYGGPVILTDSSRIQNAEKYAMENGITAGTVLGGNKLIPDVAVESIFSIDERERINVKYFNELK